MKPIITFFLVLGLGLNLSAQNDETDSVKIKLVEDYLHYAFTKQFEQQKALMHHEVVDFHPTVLQSPAKGREELSKGWKETMRQMDSAQYEKSGMGVLSMSKGEMSGKWIVVTGVLKSKFKESDRWVSSHMVGFYKIQDGLIKEVRNYGNLLDMYLQMGYTLSPSKQ